MRVHNNIKPLDDLPENLRLLTWVGELQVSLQKSHQRVLLIFQGEREWCRSCLSSLEVFAQRLVLSNESNLNNATPFAKAETVLGLESDCVVYDQFSGLNVDVLCMAVGLVRAGGVLVILMPADLRKMNDRYGQWQGSVNHHGHFYTYLERYYQSGGGVVYWKQVDPLPKLKVWPDTVKTRLRNGMSQSQHHAMEAMHRWMAGDKHLFILTADRGRGKSTLLGLFANQLDPATSFQVTAPSRAQASVLLQVLDNKAQQVFIAPDELLRRQGRVPCLLIDEAAMLPNNLLWQCVGLADKVLLATTTGGYEGTGQGFLNKFMQALQPQHYVHEQLSEPVRWARDDQLEELFNEMLMLKPVEPPITMQRADVRVWQVTRDRLLQEPGLLKNVYGLLVSAHYRTRPSDLRQLIEDDNQVLYAAGYGDSIVGVMLLNREGGFEEDLCDEIFMGKRRPQGHLLAQMLTAQAGVRNFASYRGLRVQRITVHTAYRKKGIGRRLIECARQRVVDEGLDYLGSSFALDSAMALFWGKTGFSLVHIGVGRGKSTGRQTVAVLQPGHVEIRKVVMTLHERMQQNLPVWLLTYCNDLLWQDVLALLGQLQGRYSLSAIDEDEIAAFSAGHRGLELSLGPLQRLLIMCLPRVSGLESRQARLLIEKILLNRKWEPLARTLGFSGRKAITNELRRATGICYEYYRSIKIE